PDPATPVAPPAPPGRLPGRPNPPRGASHPRRQPRHIAPRNGALPPPARSRGEQHLPAPLRQLQNHVQNLRANVSLTSTDRFASHRQSSDRVCQNTSEVSEATRLHGIYGVLCASHFPRINVC